MSLAAGIELSFINDITTQLFARFLLVSVLAFIAGLEFREYLAGDKAHQTIGTARTYTFAAILGFVLYALDPSFKLFITGMVFLGALFSLFYFRKLQSDQRGILQLLIGMIIYTFGPVSQLMPLWFLVLLFVALIFILSARPVTHQIIERMDQGELLTFAKFLLLSAVILSLLPHELVTAQIPASPFSIWLAVVIISTISYVGYILRRYVSHKQGYFVTGLLGGLYSSTACTVVLARATRSQPIPNRALHAAILAASTMMYLRLLLLVAVLSPALLPLAAPPLITVAVGTLALAYYFSKLGDQAPLVPTEKDVNPLELGTAFLFAIIFIVMLVLTRFIASEFGTSGLKMLSFATGLTDIDPFVLSLLNGAYAKLAPGDLAGALLIAAGSNGFLKGIYTVTLGNWRANRAVLMSLFLIGGLTMLWGLRLF